MHRRFSALRLRPSATGRRRMNHPLERFDAPDRRGLLELLALGFVGLAHVAVEAIWGEPTALALTGVAVLAFAGYVAIRAREAGAARRWGLRRDNLGSSLKAHLGFAAVAGSGLVALSAVLGRLEVPWTFWVVLAVYPLWGGAQQFALQNFIAANLARFTSREWLVAVGAGIAFGLSHVPRWDLTALTLVSGVLFTWIYRRHPNLWAIALSHGLLGTIAIYLIVGEDPLRALLATTVGGA